MAETGPMTQDEVLAKLREEIAELRRQAEAEADPARRARTLRRADIRESVIEDEAEAIAAEIAAACGLLAAEER
jgi:hypothetical protein